MKIVCICGPNENIVGLLKLSGIEAIGLDRSANNIGEISQINPDVLICRNRDNINEIIDYCPNIKFIFVIEVGLENLPFGKLIERNLRVANIGGISVDIMSNYVMGCILCHSACLKEDFFNQTKAYWKRYQCTESLINKTLLIVGAGRTGVQIARKASVFGMKTYGIVKTKRDIPFFDEMGTLNELDSFLQISDFVVCTIPLTAETRHLFNYDRFAQMKPTCVFINVSRGGLVNEEHLIKSLDLGQLSAAYLDVFEKEPLPENHAFWHHDRVIVTPHQSGRLFNNLEQAIGCFVSNFSAFCSDDTMPNEVNLYKGY